MIRASVGTLRLKHFVIELKGLVGTSGGPTSGGSNTSSGPVRQRDHGELIQNADHGVIHQ